MNLVRDLKLRAIYDRLPKIECRRLCQEACGPIVMARAEWDRVIDVVGYAPRPTQDQVARLRCPMLDEATGACTVYEARPLICRLFGLVKAMRCPHGCEPERWLADSEAHALLADVERIT